MNTATELLRRALDAWDENEPNDFNDCMEEIRAYLAAEEERKPKFIRKKVCWNCGWPIKETRPEPARKPMSEEEIKAEAQSEKFNRCDAIVFAVGVRFAEKHHGIGKDDE